MGANTSRPTVESKLTNFTTPIDLNFRRRSAPGRLETRPYRPSYEKPTARRTLLPENNSQEGEEYFETTTQRKPGKRQKKHKGRATADKILDPTSRELDVPSTFSQIALNQANANELSVGTNPQARVDSDDTTTARSTRALRDTRKKRKRLSSADRTWQPSSSLRGKVRGKRTSQFQNPGQPRTASTGTKRDLGSQVASQHNKERSGVEPTRKSHLSIGHDAASPRDDTPVTPYSTISPQREVNSISSWKRPFTRVGTLRKPAQTSDFAQQLEHAHDDPALAADDSTINYDLSEIASTSPSIDPMDDYTPDDGDHDNLAQSAVASTFSQYAESSDAHSEPSPSQVLGPEIFTPTKPPVQLPTPSLTPATRGQTSKVIQTDALLEHVRQRSPYLLPKERDIGKKFQHSQKEQAEYDSLSESSAGFRVKGSRRQIQQRHATGTIDKRFHEQLKNRFITDSSVDNLLASPGNRRHGKGVPKYSKEHPAHGKTTRDTIAAPSTPVDIEAQELLSDEDESEGTKPDDDNHIVPEFSAASDNTDLNEPPSPGWTDLHSPASARIGGPNVQRGSLYKPTRTSLPETQKHIVDDEDDTITMISDFHDSSSADEFEVRSAPNIVINNEEPHRASIAMSRTRPLTTPSKRKQCPGVAQEQSAKRRRTEILHIKRQSRNMASNASVNAKVFETHADGSKPGATVRTEDDDEFVVGTDGQVLLRILRDEIKRPIGVEVESVAAHGSKSALGAPPLQVRSTMDTEGLAVEVEYSQVRSQDR
ncbi:hypothetical protein ACN47E_001871 [Coniothyrium glycines]